MKLRLELLSVALFAGGCAGSDHAVPTGLVSASERSQQLVSQTYTTIDPPGSTFTEAFGLNNRGDIVGTFSSSSPAPPYEYHGFLLRAGEYSQIDFPGALCTSARRINDHGDIVGFYKTNDCPRLGGAEKNIRGYLLRDGEFYPIDVPNGRDPLVSGINNGGDIVGRYCTAARSADCRSDNGTQHGFLLSDGVFHTIDFPDATSTHAQAINSDGVIVGSYDTVDGKAHAFELSDGVFTTIDIAPGAPTVRAQGIDNEGDISGFAGNDAFIRLSDGIVTLYDFPGATTTTAHSITPRGQTVGRYCTAPNPAMCGLGAPAGTVHGYLRATEHD